MKRLVLHDSTRKALERFMAHPAHALLLTAPVGAGKTTITKFIASTLLHISTEKLETHPYVKIVKPQDGKTISVETIRNAIHFTTLRPTSKGYVTRIIIIEDSDRMTLQAQNALLKTIEEPPAGTLIILTAPSEHALLPTIRSRVQHIVVSPPELADVQDYFRAEGHGDDAIQKAALMSGVLPGLMHALLEVDTSHPLFAATIMARDILQKSLFDRLLVIDGLAKQRQLFMDTLFILTQMAHTALQQRRNDTAGIRRWQKILHATHQAEIEMAGNAQAKLVLLHFMLTI